MPISFSPLARIALALAAGLTAVPVRAADAVSGGADETSATLALRPGKMPPSVLMSPRSKALAVSDLPSERRSVRVVYQGYGETNPALRPSN